MKLRNFIIVLLAVLMVFAFASCKNEPKVEPESSYKIVRLTAEKGRADGWNEYDKFELLFATPVEKGDVVSVTYRTTRPIDQYNVRVVTTTNGDHRWVYEQDKSALTSYDDSDPDGWITVTYEFSDYADRVSGNKENHAMTDELYEGVSDFAFHFRGKIVAGDFMEIKEVLWNDEPVDISTVAKAALGKSGDVVRNEKNVEVIDSKDSTWKKDLVTYYVMFYADPTQHKKDNPVGVNYENDDYLTGIGVAVKSGEKVAKPADPEREGYTFGGWCKDKIYDGTDTTRIWDFDNDTVTENRMLYAIWTLNNNTITFNLNGGSAKEGEADAFAAQTVATAGTVTKPEAEPVVTGDKLFAVWCTDAEGQKPYDFATPVTGDLTLYARYDDPVYVTFDKNDGSADDLRLSRVPLLSGKTVSEPEDPEYGENYFAGWFLGDAAESYDFTTAVTESITLTAKWYEPVTVTLDPNYEVGGDAVATSTTTTGYGIPMAKPDDPALREGFFFDKWTTDAAGEQEYVFGEEGEAVTEAFTLYAQWLPARTVTLYRNFPDDAEDTVFLTTSIPDGEKFADPAKYPERSGYAVVKWTTDKLGAEKAYDFDAEVNNDIALYAQWGYGATYRLTASKFTSSDGNSDDKFVLQWDATTAKAKAGDVLSISFRTTEAFTQYSIRKNDSSLTKFFHEKTTSASHPQFFSTMKTGDDGWTTVTYDFPEEGAATEKPISYEEEGIGFLVYFRNMKMVPGAIMEVRAVTLRGKELSVDKENVGSYAGPILELVDEQYAWVNQTVKFNTNEGSEINNASVEFGKRVPEPENPTKPNKFFAGWYADEELTTKFDFTNTPITKETTLYAKWVDPVTLTFDSQDGSEVEAIETGIGLSIEKPKDPEKLGFIFGGWYTEAACINVFDFDSGIKASTTVYAKWIAAKVITLNPKGGTISNPIVYAETGKAISEPSVQIGKAGFFFGGWFDDADCTEGKEHDFSKVVDSDTTIYAKWVAPEKAYKFTATRDYDRFQLRWNESNVKTFDSGYYKAGDVITFMIKLESSDTTLHNIYLDVRSGGSTLKKVYLDQEDSSASGPVDGWYSVTAVVPDKDVTFGGKGLYLKVYGNANWKTNDSVIIKAFAYNGVEIPIVTGDYSDSGSMRNSGAYEGCKPNTEQVDP